MTCNEYAYARSDVCNLEKIRRVERAKLKENDREFMREKGE